MSNNQRSEWSSPALTEYGNVEQLTAKGNGGDDGITMSGAAASAEHGDYS